MVENHLGLRPDNTIHFEKVLLRPVGQCRPQAERAQGGASPGVLRLPPGYGPAGCPGRGEAYDELHPGQVDAEGREGVDPSPGSRLGMERFPAEAKEGRVDHDDGRDL